MTMKAFEELPHEYPFLLIDGVIEKDLGRSIKAIKNLTYNDKIFRGHFSTDPIYPAVLIIESLCQAAQLMFGSKKAVTAKLDSFKFLKTLRPGHQLRLEVVFESQIGPFVTSKAKAFVEDELVASGTIIGKDL